MPLAGCPGALGGGPPGSRRDHPFLRRVLPRTLLPSKFPFPSTSLGPGGQGRLLPLPCLRLRKASRAIQRPASPQRGSTIETGPLGTGRSQTLGELPAVAETHLPPGDPEQEVTGEAAAL